MRTTSFEILEKAELPAHQAHAILKVMEQELESAHNGLASKEDLFAVKADLLDVKGELLGAIADLRAEVKGDVGRIEGDLGRIEGALSRWVLTCILGQTAVLAGLGYFLVSHLAR